MLTPKGKIPPTGRLGGGSNSCCCITQDSKPDTLPSELFRPLTRTNSPPDTNIKGNSSELFWCRHIYLWRGYSLQRWPVKKWSCIYVEAHLMTNFEWIWELQPMITEEVREFRVLNPQLLYLWASLIPLINNPFNFSLLSVKVLEHLCEKKKVCFCYVFSSPWKFTGG